MFHFETSFNNTMLVRSVPDAYAAKLFTEGVLSEDERKSIHEEHINSLTKELNNTDSYQPEPYYFQKKWASFKQPAKEISIWDTGIDYGLLQYVGKKSVHTPENFVCFHTTKMC